MGKNIFVQLLKMIGVLLVFALLVLTILSAFPALTGPVESTSSYSVSNQDSASATSQSSESGSEPSDSSGTSQQATTHTVTQTTTEEMLLEKYMWIVWLSALLLTFAAFLIDAHNRTQRYRAEIPKHRANIVAATEKCTRLISQANRFVDKYAGHEGDVMKTVAAARGGQASVPAPDRPVAAEAAPADAMACDPAAAPVAPVPQTIFKSADFRAVLERYPTLLANQNTQMLLSQLERSEAAILFEKNAYNAAVAKYNTEIHTFPFSMLRRALRLTDQACYDDPGAPEVEITDDMLGI